MSGLRLTFDPEECVHVGNVNELIRVASLWDVVSEIVSFQFQNGTLWNFPL